ncbi:TVG0731430 [Thermoplasma volcanium GSS1]|uniref:TVG0731430 protein n=1 Tax=Thermoplasma volcanium (strain ATCC 51530 / DSM 4299 / JCM 9571 / NBRC 15438 / GSS1) TaxID=273116 RepID=Q97AT5_THEVO|nr:TVG0731430 [Thermoplasma volcanium GSS1]
MYIFQLILLRNGFFVDINYILLLFKCEPIKRLLYVIICSVLICDFFTIHFIDYISNATRHRTKFRTMLIKLVQDIMMVNRNRLHRRFKFILYRSLTLMTDGRSSFPYHLEQAKLSN